MRIYVLHSGKCGLDELFAWLPGKNTVTEVLLLKKAEALLERVERERPDVVFIRLGCNNVSGLRVGQMIKAADASVRIVFVADDKRYAVDAYEVGAYGYLLCPLERHKLDKCLDGIKCRKRPPLRYRWQ